MTDKVAREMTFEEEAKLYKEETAEFLKSGTVDSEPPFVNSILRRGNRIIRKASAEIERLQSENTRLNAERDKAVELAVKLIKIFAIPRKDYAEYFRKLRIGAGVYMGTGYAVMDTFFRVYDDFVDNSDDNLYRAVKRGLEDNNG